MTSVAAKKIAPTVVHKDKLDNVLEPGVHVAYPVHNQMVIGTVVKCSPKMVMVRELGVDTKSRWYSDTRKYPSECIKVDGPRLTMYIIKNSA